MDDEHGIRRIRDIDDLKTSPIARPPRVWSPSMVEYVFGIIRFYAVVGNVFDIQPIPPEFGHHLVYTKMAACQISVRVSGGSRIIDPTASCPAAGT